MRSDNRVGLITAAGPLPAYTPSKEGTEVLIRAFRYVLSDHDELAREELGRLSESDFRASFDRISQLLSLSIAGASVLEAGKIFAGIQQRVEARMEQAAEAVSLAQMAAEENQ